MRNNILVGAATALLLTIVIAALTVIYLPKKEEIIAEDPGQSMTSQLDKLEEIEYIIKEHNGYIAVFTQNSNEPELVLDVKVRVLPLYDQGQLEQGVAVKGYSALTAMLEDYIS